VATEFESKCDILSELWLNYREEHDFYDFVKYNDIGLPLAFMISEEIVTNPTDAAQSFVIEAFDLFLQALGIEDSGFTNLNEILKISSEGIEDSGV